MTMHRNEILKMKFQLCCLQLGFKNEYLSNVGANMYDVLKKVMENWINSIKLY